MALQPRTNRRLGIFLIVVAGVTLGHRAHAYAIRRTLRQPATAQGSDNMASCLKQRNFVMYGAHWCGYCKKQKSMFGSNAAYLNYVECTEQKGLCQAKGIRGYPAWEDGQGRIHSGMQSLETLSQLSGCQII